MSVLDAPVKTAPTLLGWLLRDTLLIGLFAGLLILLNLTEYRTGWSALTVIAGVLGFIAAYVTSYAVHEWGHLIGARLTGSEMPLRPYTGALIGHFAIEQHSVRQFLWLSWGGIAGYLLVLIVVLQLYFAVYPTGGTVGLAIGVLAFSSQSLAVDLPQVLRVQRGEPPTVVSASGASRKIILRRTAQSWTVLALVLLVWNYRPL